MAKTVAVNAEPHETLHLSPLDSNATDVVMDGEQKESDDMAVLGEKAEGEEEEERLTWGSKMDFLLSTIGFAVDLSNVFRFPYLCYRNGGGAFLVPYFVMLLLGALPLFYMEVIIGQYHRSGCLTVWKICPIFKGLGWATCLLNFYVALYYNAVICWAFYYLFVSFSPTLPWTLCNQVWNTEHCWSLYNHKANATNATIGYMSNSTNTSLLISKAVSPTKRISSAAEYFEFEVLKVTESSGFHSIGSPNWQLTLCLLLVFVCLYFSLFKGVKSMGKAVWITAILPYIVLGVLLVRGVILEGAREGILYFISPNFSKLLDPVVWSDAAIQIFFSVGSGFGVHMAYSSYNNFHNNLFRDCLIASGVNSFTSLFSGFVVFAFLGYMAQQKSMNISDVVNDNPGLIFMVYPEALATLPGSQFWSVLFFIMLISLGLDSSFGALEAMITAIRDECYFFFKKWGKYNRELLTLVFVIVIFICALPNVCYGGIYVIQFLDNYGAGITLLIALWLQTISVSWFYGIKKLSSDHEEMMGNKPGLVWIILWKYVTPILLILIIVARLSTLRILSLDLNFETYVYPTWSSYVGAFVVLSSLMLIPITAVIKIVRAQGDGWYQKVALLISPTEEHHDIKLRRHARRMTRRHWLSFP